jgi:transposase-like protein
MNHEKRRIARFICRSYERTYVRDREGSAKQESTTSAPRLALDIARNTPLENTGSMKQNASPTSRNPRPPARAEP